MDLGNYLDSLKREVIAPGDTTSFATVDDNTWLGHLADAFWECRLDGLLQGFSCDDNGIIMPITTKDPAAPWETPTSRNWAADAQDREMVQLVVLYASFRILRNSLRGLRTAFRAQAGAVTYEYQQSANLLTELIKDIINRRDLILMRLSDLGMAPVYAIDAIVARDTALMDASIYWVGSGAMVPDIYGLYGLSN